MIKFPSSKLFLNEISKGAIISCYFIALLCVGSCASINNNLQVNCKKHFSGKWKYDKFSTSIIYVTRTKKKQFEHTQNGKYYYEYDLKWLEKCKYQMTLVSITDPNPAIAKEGDILIVEITSSLENKMSYKTIYKNKQRTGNMTRID